MKASGFEDTRPWAEFLHAKKTPAWMLAFCTNYVSTYAYTYPTTDYSY